MTFVGHGIDNLVMLVKQMKFPWLLSNLFDILTGRPLGDAKVMHMLEWQGVRVMLFLYFSKDQFIYFSNLLLPRISISPSFCSLQSACHKFHFIETTLLKLTKDIMETFDSGKITILTALDMFAAFDTLDHTTLLHRLQHTFGLSGYVISWIHFYLTYRTSFVKIDLSSLSGQQYAQVYPRALF